MYERLWFTGLVCLEIISAGEVSSMNQCLSVFAAAAGRLITGCLCVVGQMMLTLDELNLTSTVKTKCEHDGQMLFMDYQYNAVSLYMTVIIVISAMTTHYESQTEHLITF